MHVVIFSITCFVFLLLFVGLPIIGVACLIINFVENRRNKRYLEWIEHLDKVNNNHIHYTRQINNRFNEKDYISKEDKL